MIARLFIPVNCWGRLNDKFKNKGRQKKSYHFRLEEKIWKNGHTFRTGGHNAEGWSLASDLYKADPAPLLHYWPSSILSFIFNILKRTKIFLRKRNPKVTYPAVARGWIRLPHSNEASRPSFTPRAFFVLIEILR